MNYIIFGISCYLAVFLVRKLSKPLELLAEKSVSLLDALLSSEDEEIKVQKVQSRTFAVLKYLLIAFIIFSMVICVAIVPVWLTNKILDPKLGSDFSPFNWKGILALTVGSTLGFVVPKPKTKGDYTLVIKLLHRLILDNYNLHIKLHKREVKRHHLKSKTSREDFIIITGLARAGTTSLLNKLANKKNIKSLHYGNMPFLLAPNLWKRFYNPTPGELKERSHKDGIMVNNVSYEALEEYFFKAISNDSYILETDINEYELSSEDCQAYLDYQMLLRADSADRYLAKNNNFLIRYDAIRKYNSEFKMILMFRAPLTHAASLLEKHIQYSESQEHDSFQLEYMNWLGHHEFGLNQKPFYFTGGKQIIEKDSDKFHLDYWLQSWLNYYTKAIHINSLNVLYVCYEDYCSEPKKHLENILEFLAIPESVTEEEPYSANREVSKPYSKELLLAANEIYEKLKTK